MLDDQAANTSASLSSVLPDHLPSCDLVLYLGESDGAAQLLPDIVARTGARALIAPVDDVAWLSDSMARQLHARLAEMGVTAVFPKPFCSLTERSCRVDHEVVSFDDPWIGEFARRFGRPVFRIECNDQWILEVDVERDTPCGCARAAADQLVGVDVQKSVAQAGLFHRQYPCLAGGTDDPGPGESLIEAAGDLMRGAVEVEVRPCLSQEAYSLP
ncbi:MAG: hypothetical protein GWN66_23745 [Pseudomonas stutzeri]|nr:hypothetical protein [Stutzerimonas stutzeri]